MSNDTITHKVTGMSCEHCVAAITSEVTALEAVETVTVDLTAGIVTVTGTGLDDAAIRGAIDEAGYDVSD